LFDTRVGVQNARETKEQRRVQVGLLASSVTLEEAGRKSDTKQQKHSNNVARKQMLIVVMLLTLS